jgi:type III secretion system low calcium response chaperone LcrH/SycD
MSTTTKGLARPKVTPEVVKIVLATLRNAPPFYTKRGLKAEDIEALYAAGYNLYSAGQFKEAADIFRLLCTYEHRNPRNWMALGGASQHINNHQSANAAFAMAGILDPVNPDARMHAADSFIALKDYNGARKCAEAAITICGDRPELSEIKQRAIALRDALAAQNN